MSILSKSQGGYLGMHASDLHVSIRQRCRSCIRDGPQGKPDLGHTQSFGSDRGRENFGRPYEGRRVHTLGVLGQCHNSIFARRHSSIHSSSTDLVEDGKNVDEQDACRVPSPVSGAQVRSLQKAFGEDTAGEDGKADHFGTFDDKSASRAMISCRRVE